MHLAKAVPVQNSQFFAGLSIGSIFAFIDLFTIENNIAPKLFLVIKDILFKF